MSRLKTLKTLKPRVNVVSKPFRSPGRHKRVTGRHLQDIRLKAWLRFPYCAMCGKPVGYPEGFELDHIVPLFKGGEDIDTNRQILCITDGKREGCHAKKTRDDMRR